VNKTQRKARLMVYVGYVVLALIVLETAIPVTTYLLSGNKTYLLFVLLNGVLAIVVTFHIRINSRLSRQ